MSIDDWNQKKYPLHISTYAKMSQKIKKLTKDELNRKDLNV